MGVQGERNHGRDRARVAFGVFDHVDASGLPITDLFEMRLKLAEVYDRCGFRGYHVAEHHGTPLGMAPSPSVLLAAIAARTRRLRIGPLIYMLPMHHPLRLIEEVCMLDQLSRGRFMLGVGRGVSPIEMGFYGVVPGAEAQARFQETFAILMAGLHAPTLDHVGPRYSFSGVPMTLRPFQQPHPELWYGIGRSDSIAWAAANAVNVVTLAAASTARAITDSYRAEWARVGQPAARIPLMGLSRHIVVAGSDATAQAIAARAYRRWQASFYQLWEAHGIALPGPALYPPSWEELEARGNACAGSPETIRRYVARETETAGANYLAAALAFGDISLAEATRSAELLAGEVMPAFGREPAEG